MVTVPNYDALRERVKDDAESAVNDRLGDTDDSDDAADGLLDPSDIVSRGWDLSEYNDFFSDCRQAGYSASDCGSMWTAAKEAGATAGSAADSGTQSGSGTPSPASSQQERTDVLILEEEGESSSLTAQYLADPITDGEIEVMAVESDAGEQLVDAVDETPAIPAHIVVEDQTASVGDLEALFDRFA